MKYPSLRLPDTYREQVDVFLGWNNAGRIGDGEFADMRNLTSDRFPLLAPRKRRGIYARGNVQGLIAKDSLCWVDGTRFVMDGYAVEMNLSDTPKQLVGMGAYVIIFPDKKYINTACLTDFGDLEAEVITRGTVTYTPAGLDGQTRIPDYVQSAEPTEPENMALWMDTSTSPAVLMQWSAGAGMWTEAAQSFVKISCPGLGAAFGQYDGVTLTGGLPEFAGSNVIWERGEDFILIPGVLDAVKETAVSLTVSRKLPPMDFVIENGNRLWGCRYGLSADGKPINEIYASRLGDFKNWSCFMGLASDSYVVSLGADGPFTGAAAHLGYPIFFRENCIHKLYGTCPANFRLQTTPCRGVQRGSDRSIALVGDVLYYKSDHGICAYDGSLPVEKLNISGHTEAVGGGYGNKYYVSMRSAGGEYRLFVYDSLRNLWHKEDALRVRGFCACREELFAYTDGEILGLLGSGETEKAVSWMAETGDIGAELPGSKYLSQIDLRLRLETGSVVTVMVNYDSGRVWERLAVLRSNRLDGFSIPLRLRRCGHLRLRLEGTGAMELYSLTKTMEMGSDLP